MATFNFYLREPKSTKKTPIVLFVAANEKAKKIRTESENRFWQIAILTSVVLSSAHSFATAQFAIIKDKDGYTNIREKPSSESKVVGRIYDTYAFYYSEIADDREWVEVGYGKALDEMSKEERDFYLNTLRTKSNDINITGFIHKSRLQPFSNMKEINGDREFREGVLRISNDTLSFEIESYRFDATKHQIVIDDTKTVTKIDHLRPYGVFTNIPRVGIRSVRLTIRSKDVIIPKTEYQDLFEPGLERMNLRIDDKGILYIISSNSDGAGGYELVWVVRKAKYIKREILIP